MKITRKDVEYVATLAHLELSPEEQERMREQLDSILAYVDKLNQLDTTDVEAMAQVVAESAPEAWREDKTRRGLSTGEALANAPEAKELFFKVPKVIER